MALQYHTKRRIAVTVTIGAVALCAVLFINLCSSTDSHRRDTAVQAVTNPDEADPADILSHPQAFDARTVAETAEMVSADRDLTPAESARAIVVAESAVNRLGQILEGLVANDDPADTWNAMNELADDRWPAQTAVILGELSHRPLVDTERARLDAVNRAAERNAGLVATLRATMPRPLPDIFR